MATIATVHPETDKKNRQNGRIDAVNFVTTSSKEQKKKKKICKNQPETCK